ncbi:Uncharacterised protein (plasmid) [Tsukamurella tyrosinosolvens]|uniref:Uncharacterized protein n=1 Tax=Tsukamurella tyrosinosolvens TaxID=57704 RepID=A0A1H4UUG4_TSUTY|nr:hypothetical protein [Tsukamurella tyrosinosolvens]SEC72385.1 hypothetical protein SAMN04489793_3041 [Tsukamurella tyrosinosolvens]VEH90873.1 Uncharacterised protein [Tsukamurella tyrosinosolvens]
MPEFNIRDGSGQLRAVYDASTEDDALGLYEGEAPVVFDDAYAVLASEDPGPVPDEFL